MKIQAEQLTQTLPCNNLRYRTLAANGAGQHQSDVVGKPGKQVDLVRNHESGQLSFTREASHQAHKFHLKVDVKVGSEFVQQQDSRLLSQRTCQQQSLSLPAGKFADARFGMARKLRQRERRQRNFLVVNALEPEPRQMRRSSLHGEFEDRQLRAIACVLRNDGNLTRDLPAPKHAEGSSSIQQDLS